MIHKHLKTILNQDWFKGNLRLSLYVIFYHLVPFDFNCFPFFLYKNQIPFLVIYVCISHLRLPIFALGRQSQDPSVSMQKQVYKPPTSKNH